MRSVYGYALALSIGFGGSWYVQWLRWDAEVKEIRLASANATIEAVGAINSQLIQSRAETESIRKTYLYEKEKANREIDDLERRVTAGPERLYVKASCPTSVPTDGSDAGRANEGAAELAPEATKDLFDFERAYNDQFEDYKFCWRELKKRSAPSK